MALIISDSLARFQSSVADDDGISLCFMSHLVKQIILTRLIDLLDNKMGFT